MNSYRHLLPIHLQNNITTYLFDALPVCVITAYPHLYGGFLNHYVNLYTTVEKYKIVVQGFNKARLWAIKCGKIFYRNDIEQYRNYKNRLCEFIECRLRKRHLF